MAKSVLELAVQTGQWDSGLKKAKNALNNFTEASGGLNKALQNDSEKMQKFVQMMGRTESTARTAKGQMNDYKATIEQLTMQYNRMTDAQKSSVGQDYLKSIEQIKQKYREVNDQVKALNDSLNGASSSGGGFLSGIGGKMSGALQVFAGNMLTKAAGAGLGMVDEMAGMVQQGIELAKAGEGIRIAFERLGRGDILDGLRQATHGTVTDLELMKAAVKFNDFKLPLNELGTMLAFAQQKAKDTGQSVDYMVDSIVTGLGRKSLMILDNLGLSANEIKEKMKETGDMTTAVGAIIREQMSKAGDYVETAADRAAQANVSLQNKMEELGRKFAPVEEASNQLWTSMKIAILDVVGGPLAKLLNGLTEAGRLRNQINAYNGGGNGKQTHLDRVIGMLRHYSGDKQGLYNRQVENYNREINWRTQYAKDIRDWQSGNRSDRLRQRIAEGQRRAGTDVLDAAEMDRQANAWREISRQYQAAAKTILNPQAPSPAGTTGGGTTTTTTKGGKTIVEEKKQEATFQQIIAGLEKEAMTATGERYDTLVRLIRLYDSAIAKEKEMRAQMHGTNEERDEFQEWGPLDEWNDQLKTLRAKQSHAQTREEYASYGEQIRTTQKNIDEFTGGNDNKESSLDKLIKDIDKGNELYSKAVGGISNIVGGMQQLGVEIPEGLSNLLNALGGISTILTGISSILSFISVVSSAKPFALGAVVKAATGVVAGRNFSGDTVPALLNSGEVVLNRAEVGTLAQNLENGNRNESVDRQPYVTGEYIWLGVNNYLRSIGMGSIVTAKQ